MNLSALKVIRKHALDLLFPILCLECGLEGSYLCRRCTVTLKRDEFQICPVCGKKSPFGLTHPICRAQPDDGPHLDGLISAAPYKEPLVRKLVETCKYRLVQDIAPILGGIIWEEIQNQELVEYFKYWTIIPLPLHGSRLKWRGFNQAELIAQKISELSGIPMRTNLLARLKKTKVQAELKDDERIINVKSAFSALQDLRGRKIIIIDDVATTRSTLNQACIALKQSGATEVWGWVFAQG